MIYTMIKHNKREALNKDIQKRLYTIRGRNYTVIYILIKHNKREALHKDKRSRNIYSPEIGSVFALINLMAKPEIESFPASLPAALITIFSTAGTSPGAEYSTNVPEPCTFL